MRPLLLVLALAAPARKPPARPAAPAVEVTNVGPASRKPRSELAVKKEVAAFLKQAEAAEKEGAEADAALYDFPAYVVTDDAKGRVLAREYTREEWLAEMKPVFEAIPGDVKVTHRDTVTVLSDALALVVDDWSMAMGRKRVTGRSAMTVVKKDGKWLWKTFTEAGWGSAGK